MRGVIWRIMIPHAVLDLVCVASVLTHVAFLQSQQALGVLMVYNILAFGLRLVFGPLNDRYATSRLMVVMGVVLVASGTGLIGALPILGVVVVAVGNALFHVGGAQYCFAYPKSGAAVGWFFAFGAVGLALGGILPMLGWYHPVWAMALLLVCLFVLRPLPSHWSVQRTAQYGFGWAGIVVAIFTVSLGLQSLAPIDGYFAWKDGSGWLGALIIAMAVGRVMGGALLNTPLRHIAWLGPVAAGWLLPLATQQPIFGVVSMALLHGGYASAITLGVSAWPQRTGLVFGLVSLGILGGSLPLLSPLRFTWQSQALSQGVLIMSGMLICAGMYIVSKKSSRLA